MSFFLMLMLNLINSSFLLLTNHPLSMMLILINQTLLISLITGLKIFTFWFSYILFMVFLGGMLILFIYISSLASNEMFNFSKNFFIMIYFWLFLFSIILFFTKDFLILNLNLNTPETKSINFINFLNENSLMLNKIYSSPMNLISIILMIFLFLTLIAIVKITNLFEGPLRPKF